MRSILVRTRDWLLVALLTTMVLLVAYQIPYTYTLNLGDVSTEPFISGWHAVENSTDTRFRWSTGNASLLFPAVVQNEKYQLNLRLAAGPRPDSALAQVTVRVNGTPVQAIQARPEFRQYRVTIDSALAGRAHNLSVELGVPPFNPSETIEGNQDNRSLGVMVERATLQPVGAPDGWIARPPLTAWLGWLLAGWLWFALILRLRALSSRRAHWIAVLAGAILLALALILARPWVAILVWYIAAALALAAVLAPSFLKWLGQARAMRRIPFEFLHTLGIPNARVRLVVELALIIAAAIYYLANNVLPYQRQVLGDFYVYYAGANVWLHGGNFYDQNQLQQFNVAHKLLNSPIGPFTSPPSALLLFAPFAVLPIAQAKLAWLVFTFVLLAGSGLFLWLAVRAVVSHPPSPIWLALMFVLSGSLADSFAFGQVNPLYSFLFALGLWGWTQRRTALAGAAMAVGAAVKVFSGIYVAYFILKREWRALAGSVIAGVVIAAVTALLTSIPAWLNYILDILPDASEHRVSSFDQSLLVLLRRINSLVGWLPDNDTLDKTPGLQLRLLTLGISILLVALTAWWIHHYARGDALHQQIEFAVVIPLMMLILPRMWEHYLMWLILPLYLLLAVLANRALSLRTQLGFLLLIGLSWVISQDGPELFTRPGFPQALISLGYYGTCLIYSGLLYLLARLPATERVPEIPNEERAVTPFQETQSVNVEA